MSFQYTDRILDYQPNQSIRALKNVTRNESFFYRLPDGKRVLSPAVLIEAGVQAGAWLCMKDCDFTHRPVLLADEDTTIHRTVSAGEQIEYNIELLSRDDEVVCMSGRGYVNGDPVITANCVRGYLLPMEEFASPKVMNIRFDRLFRPDCRDLSPLHDFIRIPELGGALYHDTCRLPILDAVGEHEFGKKVVAYKNTSCTESYLLEHFPHKPIVPGVILLSMIGEAAQLMSRRRLDQRPDVFLLPINLHQIRFRSFVTPGDGLQLSLKWESGTFAAGETVTVKAILQNQAKRVLSGTMSFTVISMPKTAQRQNVTSPATGAA